MPEVLAPTHPLVTELRALGPEGVQVRRDLTGTRPMAVCLFHGVHEVWVQFAVFQPMLGHRTMGRGVVIVNAVSPCWPGCGALYEWR